MPIREVMVPVAEAFEPIARMIKAVGYLDREL